MSKVPSKKVEEWNEIRKKDSQNPRALDVHRVLEFITKY